MEWKRKNRHLPILCFIANNADENDAVMDYKKNYTGCEIILKISLFSLLSSPSTDAPPHPSSSPLNFTRLHRTPAY